MNSLSIIEVGARVYRINACTGYGRILLVKEIVRESWTCQTRRKTTESGTFRVVCGERLGLKEEAAKIEGRADDAIERAATLSRICSR
jgi:hypothetical protein